MTNLVVYDNGTRVAAGKPSSCASDSLVLCVPSLLIPPAVVAPRQPSAPATPARTTPDTPAGTPAPSPTRRLHPGTTPARRHHPGSTP